VARIPRKPTALAAIRHAAHCLKMGGTRLRSYGAGFIAAWRLAIERNSDEHDSVMGQEHGTESVWERPLIFRGTVGQVLQSDGRLQPLPRKVGGETCRYRSMPTRVRREAPSGEQLLEAWKKPGGGTTT
jgi:hypothetical protein